MRTSSQEDPARAEAEPVEGATPAPKSEHRVQRPAAPFDSAVSIEESLLQPVGLPEPSAQGILAAGSRFGGYIVGACIGQGGMARIYRAEHEGLRRHVALKVLTEGFSNKAARERFLREARLAASIKHPNVVNIFDVGVHNGVPYLVMELLEGEDLEALLQSRGALDEGTIVDIMLPVVAGLMAVHEAGVVHRDLKPGNIFLTRGRNDEIEPKLLDFGISKAICPHLLTTTAGNTTQANGLLMGTPFYISPEAVQGREVTARSDQYSIGVVLYECAAGFNPFTANTFAEVVQRITTGNYVPPGQHCPRISKRLSRIIERAMSLEPERRFPDLAHLGRELLQLAGQRTRITWGLTFGYEARLDGLDDTPAPLRGRFEPMLGWSRRKGVGLSIAGAAALGALATLGWNAVSGSRAEPAPAERVVHQSSMPVTAPLLGAARAATTALPLRAEPPAQRSDDSRAELGPLVPSLGTSLVDPAVALQAATVLPVHDPSSAGALSNDGAGGLTPSATLDEKVASLGERVTSLDGKPVKSTRKRSGARARLEHRSASRDQAAKSDGESERKVARKRRRVPSSSAGDVAQADKVSTRAPAKGTNNAPIFD